MSLLQMPKIGFLVLIVFLIVPVGFAGEVPLVQLEGQFNQIAKNTFPSIVSISRESKEQKAQHDIDVGSGVIVDERGYVLTNYHLVREAVEGWVFVRLLDGAEYTGKVIGSDSKFDLALIKISAPNLSAVTFADFKTVQVGDWAIAIGNPYGFLFQGAGPSMSVGIISALGRSLPSFEGEVRSYTDLIQTDTSIHLGSSGGALLNVHGKVVGINVAIVSASGGSEGMGFAIPSQYCLEFVNQYQENENVSEL